MTAVTKPKQNPVLKMVLEFGPLVIFFFVNAKGEMLMNRFGLLSTFGKPIFLATAVFMVAITIALIASWILTRRLAVMPMVTGVVVLLFGGLTLYLHDDTFIKMKPTIVNVLFGGVLLGGLFFGKSLLTYVFEDAFHLSDHGWRTLTWRWGIFFLFLAVVNEVVWRSQTTDFWVAFKVWGIMPITMGFAMLQMPFIMKHMKEEKD